MKAIIKQFLLAVCFGSALASLSFSQSVPQGFIDPPREFSLMPFWFWNDTLKDQEIVRQIDDFEKHGVYGFVIHPRIGLPENIKWLGPEMIHAMNVALGEASKRKMLVVLYDEGMYPSGSSGGQVVEANPEYAARGLAKTDLMSGEEFTPPEKCKLLTIIDRSAKARTAIFEKPSGGTIRGLHYINEGKKDLREENPPAADILNPGAVSSFMNLVYERYSREFGKYFGNTIIGIFTDEPSILGRGSEKGLMPGSAASLGEISRILGYDFTPFLADLWYDDHSDSGNHRADYFRAINIILDQNYYARLGKWCADHGIALMGHPAGSMDIGTEKYFQVPGQDLVWRYVEPGPKSLEGEHSTMAKCASGAMVHLGLRRNSNELYGAYGHNLTYGEMLWLADWCFIRGQNMLFPHAFYYSVRGPRLDERPPDVGPHSEWWEHYNNFADHCRRICWVNTDCREVCNVAIMCEAAWLPWKAARICYMNQEDFNYLQINQLYHDTTADDEGIHIAGMNYKAVIIDSLSFVPDMAVPILRKLAESGRLIIYGKIPANLAIGGVITTDNEKELTSAIRKLQPPDIMLNPGNPDIRFRHVIKDTIHYYLIFNEGDSTVGTGLSFSVKGEKRWLDTFTAQSVSVQENETAVFKPHELKIMMISTAR
jgi:hypothetical protein